MLDATSSELTAPPALEVLESRGRQRVRFAFLGCAAFSAGVAWSITWVTASVFESILTLLYTAPAIVLAIYGVARVQVQRLAQASGTLRDRVARRFQILNWAAGTLLIGSLYVGLVSVSAMPWAAGLRWRVLIALFGSLFGVYVLVEALVLSRQSLTPDVLGERLVGGFRDALDVGDASAARERSEALMNLALVSLEEGRLSDFRAFIHGLAKCLALAQKRGQESDGVRLQFFQLASRVVGRFEFIKETLSALTVNSVSTSHDAGVAEDLTEILLRILESHPRSDDLVRVVLGLLPASTPDGLWHEPAAVALTSGVTGPVMTGITERVIGAWTDRSMEDDELAGIVDAVLRRFSDQSSRSAARRVSAFLAATDAARPIPVEAARRISERLPTFVSLMSGSEIQELLGLLAERRSIALESLRQLEGERDPLPFWSLFLRLVRASSRTQGSTPSVSVIPDEAHIRSMFRACIDVMGGGDPPSTSEVAVLVDALAPLGCGLFPMVAYLQVAAGALASRSGSPSAEIDAGALASWRSSLEGWSFDRLGPDFSKPLPSEAIDDDRHAFPERVGDELIYKVLEEVVDVVEAEAADRPIMADLPGLLPLLLVVLLETVRVGEFNPRCARLIGRLLDSAGSPDGLLDLLDVQERSCVADHCRQIEHLILPNRDAPSSIGLDDGPPSPGVIVERRSDDWDPARFMVSLSSGVAALVIVAAVRSIAAVDPGPAVSREVRLTGLAQRLVQCLLQPHVRVETVSSHLLGLCPAELGEALVRTRPLRAANLAGRDAMVRLLAPDLSTIWQLYRSRDISGLVARAAILAMHLEFGLGPSAGSGLKRTKRTFATAVVLLLVLEGLAASDGGVDAERVLAAIADLRNRLEIWLSAAVEEPKVWFSLALIVQDTPSRQLWETFVDDHQVELNRMLVGILESSGVGVAPRHVAASRSVDLVLRTNRWLEMPVRSARRMVPGVRTAPKALTVFLSGVMSQPRHPQLLRIADDLMAALTRCRSISAERQRRGLPIEPWEVDYATAPDEDGQRLLREVIGFIARHSDDLKQRDRDTLEWYLPRVAAPSGEPPTELRSLIRDGSKHEG